MRFFESIDREAIAGLLERDEYFWLDLTDPGKEEIRASARSSPSTRWRSRTAAKRGQRPKLDDFGDYMFLVYYGGGEGEAGSRSSWRRSTPSSAAATSSPSHQGGCAALEEARERLEAQTPRSEQFVVYRVLDGLTDTFFPILESLDERMERLDGEIFDRPQPRQLEEITALRRELVALRRVVTPQRDLLARGSTTSSKSPASKPTRATTSATSTTTRSGSPTRSTPTGTCWPGPATPTSRSSPTASTRSPSS